jgi:hypothetical protein
MLTVVVNWINRLFGAGEGALSFGETFAQKYAKPLLLILLLFVVSKITSGNQLKLKV